MLMTDTRKTATWKEPKRTGGPTMTTLAVAEYLEFDKEWVHKLVAAGPERGGLAGYIPARDGLGWQRKTRRGNLNRAVMFYEEDVRAWNESHPHKEREPEAVSYTEEQANTVLLEAQKMLAEGKADYINRAELMRRLTWKPGTYDPQKKRGISRDDPGYGQTLWNTRTYKIVKQILDDNSISLSPVQQRNKLKSRRKY